MFNSSFIKVFQQEIQKLLKDAVNEWKFQEEALLLAKVVKICCTDLFKNDITFSGNLVNPVKTDFW